MVLFKGYTKAYGFRGDGLKTYSVNSQPELKKVRLYSGVPTIVSVHNGLILSSGSNYGRCAYLITNGYNIGVDITTFVGVNITITNTSCHDGYADVTLVANIDSGTYIDVNVWNF